MSFIVNASFALPLYIRYACLFSMYEAIIKKQMIIRNNPKKVLYGLKMRSWGPRIHNPEINLFICLSTME